jgi:hypothetical protein
MWSLILNAFVSYIQKNPEVIEQLIEQGFTALINELKAKNAAK